MSLHSWTYPYRIPPYQERMPIQEKEYAVFVNPYPAANNTVLCGRVLAFFDKNDVPMAKLLVGDMGIVEVGRNYIFHLQDLDFIREAIDCTLAVLNYEYRQVAALAWAQWDTINHEFKEIIQNLCPMDEMIYYTGSKPEQIEAILNRIISGNLEGVKPKNNPQLPLSPDKIIITDPKEQKINKKGIKSSFNKNPY
jgi:hypothetical protein